MVVIRVAFWKIYRKAVVFKVFLFYSFHSKRTWGIMVKEMTRHQHRYGPYSSTKINRRMSIISIARKRLLKCRRHLPWTNLPFRPFSIPDRCKGVSCFTINRTGADSALHIWSGPARSGPCTTLPSSTVRSSWM